MFIYEVTKKILEKYDIEQSSSYTETKINVLFGYSLGLRTMWARSESVAVMSSKLGWVSSTSQVRLGETFNAVKIIMNSG